MKNLFKDFEGNKEEIFASPKDQKNVVNFGMPGHEDAEGYYINPRPQKVGYFGKFFSMFSKLNWAKK